MGMTKTEEAKQPSIDYCGIADRRLLKILGDILVHNRMPEDAGRFETEMVLGLLAYEYGGENGQRSYHLSVRGHLVYDLLANNGKAYLENGDEKW